MKNKKIKLFICFFAFLFAHSIEAKVKLPALISDGMVLQRDREINIWGNADAGEKVVVLFKEKRYTTIADSSGNWLIVLQPQSAGGPFEMTVNELKVKDILIGDVWICAGQSNMELPIRRVMDLYREDVESYNNPMIRHIKIPLSYNFHNPQKEIRPTTWEAVSQDDVLSFSAVAYFFARDLYDKIKIPIGLINTGVGGSPAEAWISEEGLKQFPHYLNERDILRSDSYIQHVKNLDRERRDLWNAVLYGSDPGLKGGREWSSFDVDDSNWEEVDLLDKSWGNDDVNPINGSHWLRKEFILSPQMNGKSAVLRLGCIVDADSVFINGTFIGTTAYQYPPRIYDIPENILREGVNNITVRLISYTGNPGFVEDKPYKIIVEEEEVGLEGRWKYKLGARMPELPGETFFQYKPIGLYNAMISPLAQWSTKGVLWYQGESNTGKYNEYYELMEALIGDWRSLWNQPALPFVIVQLANFMQDPTQPAESNWAELRSKQFDLSKKINNTGLVVTVDIGEWNDIHPLNKKEVGRRLSLQAQKLVYGDREVIATGPVYRSMEVKGNKVILRFEEGSNDLMPVDTLKGFAIAGKNGNYEWAEAVVEGDKVVVWNNQISTPVKVRYGWGNNPQHANLKNKAALPASPFEAKLSD